jgi:hypothetical protein
MRTPRSSRTRLRGIRLLALNCCSGAAVASCGSRTGLFRVSTATAACTSTRFMPGQNGFSTFGMGFASDFGGPAARLYVSDNDFDGTLRGLGGVSTCAPQL